MGSYAKFVVYACAISCLICINGQDDSDKLWILIDNANMFTCQGAQNQFTLTKDDVSVKDQNGKTVELIEAPGTYYLQFDNIKVLKQLGFLSGRMGTTLQIPVISSGLINLDFPYQVIPQKTILEGSTCDNESGVIYDSSDKREYCKYCNLCDTSSHVEAKLTSSDLGHVYSPTLGSGQEGSFTKVCSKIDSTTYSLKRSVVLPGRKELEKEASDRYKGTLEGTVQNKLKIGKGKLQVFLNLDSTTKPPVDSNQWYSNNKSCACCVKDNLGNSNCQASFVERIVGKKSSTCLKCNNQYVKSCLQENPQRVGCFVVEYNFRVTVNRSDYETFKKELAARKQGKPVQGSVATSIGSGSSADVKAAPAPANAQQTPTTTPAAGGSGSGGSGPKPCDNCDAQQCKNSMDKNYLSYCGTMETRSSAGRRYCCGRCPSVCSV